MPERRLHHLVCPASEPTEEEEERNSIAKPGDSDSDWDDRLGFS